MKKIWLFFVFIALACSSTAAFGAAEADSPNIPCPGYGDNFVRLTVPVTILATVPGSGGRAIVDFKFSTGMSGKDFVIPIMDGVIPAGSGATLTLEGFCEPNDVMNVHWGYNSGSRGSTFSVEFGPASKISAF